MYLVAAANWITDPNLSLPSQHIDLKVSPSASHCCLNFIHITHFEQQEQVGLPSCTPASHHGKYTPRVAPAPKKEEKHMKQTWTHLTICSQAQINSTEINLTLP